MVNCIGLGRPASAFIFFFNDPATTEIYTLSLHDALPIRWTPVTLAAVVLPLMLIYIAFMRIDAANADLEIGRAHVSTPVTQ